ncbi:MAG: MBL fold metallo-hydrolase [Candidatus Hadarchaeia archaeon]
MRVHTIGGYKKVGKNMTAVEINNQIIVFDMGADIERIVEHEENIEEMKTVEAIESKIVPNDSKLKNEMRDKVKAIVIGHGHQDHTRGIPKLAGAYDCPIITTPYTANIIERFIENDNENVTNDIIRMNPGESIRVSRDIDLEFINITHSIPHSVLSVLKTPEGNLVYSLDFKLDDNPTMNDPINYDKIRKIGEQGVKTYIADCTRADQPGRAKTENETRMELKRIMTENCDRREGMIITTFSSHIARLNNIIDANNGRRKIAMLGRSLKEYTKDAEKLGLIDLSNIEIASWREEVEDLLIEASKNKSDYLIVSTGNQGEPNAMLSRISNGDYPYTVEDGDLVIFSSVTIPTDINELNREYLKRNLRRRGADLELDVHSHGHAMGEDHRDMLRMLDPETVIPAHGGGEKLGALAKLAREEGIEKVKLSSNGGAVTID